MTGRVIFRGGQRVIVPDDSDPAAADGKSGAHHEKKLSDGEDGPADVKDAPSDTQAREILNERNGESSRGR